MGHKLLLVESALKRCDHAPVQANLLSNRFSATCVTRCTDAKDTARRQTNSEMAHLSLLVLHGVSLWFPKWKLGETIAYGVLYNVCAQCMTLTPKDHQLDGQTQACLKSTHGAVTPRRPLQPWELLTAAPTRSRCKRMLLESLVVSSPAVTQTQGHGLSD